MSMERVKEIEECIEWAKNHLVNPPANLETEDIQFLIDTIKQQNEQIKGVTYWRDFYFRKSRERNQRIEELEQSNIEGWDYAKTYSDRAEKLEKVLKEIVDAKGKYDGFEYPE